MKLKEKNTMSAPVVDFQTTSHDTLSRNIHQAARQSKDGHLTPEALLLALKRAGLEADDPRIAKTVKTLRGLPSDGVLEDSQVQTIIAPENATLIARGLSGDLVIPTFEAFEGRITDMYREVSADRSGEVASYIPQLARVDPELFAVAVCTVDGQQFSIGDDSVPFCVQSVCKPTNYAIALNAMGRDAVHQHVGREPSGLGFNELTLNQNGLPHNPMINAGAIACASLIEPDRSNADRFDHVMQVWRALCGNTKAGFDNTVFLSEKETADRNFALAYMMREQGAFPPDTDILQTLDLYFQTCSITVDVKQLAVLAATYANAGLCPLTSTQVFESEVVKDALSLMASCGMYDFSGEYAFSVGIPAKSGVSGGMFLVVPGVCGIALYSPRLDPLGNPVRGVAFSKRLVETYAFHTYANMLDDHTLIDPRRPLVERKANEVTYLCSAAARGDNGEIRRLVASGIDPSTADYDGRTALHLAASEGQERTVRYLLSLCADIAPKDRWGHSPLDDAKREGRDEIVRILEEAYASQEGAA
ncbi:MAG: glutaminase A [Pseudomonadota bacterium]